MAGSGLLVLVAVVVGIVVALSDSSGDDGRSDVSSRAAEGSALQPASGRVGIAVGDQIPDVSIGLIDGSNVNVASLVSAHKPVFLFFFATW